MSRRLLIANASPSFSPDWRWISGRLDSDRYDWRFFNTAPQNGIERLVHRPDMARFRCCRELARSVGSGPVNLIVTHSPLVTCWSELFAKRRRLRVPHGRKRVPHLAFAFNFTHLPRGLRRTIMRRAFSTVDRFTVFSRFERTLYAEYFDIPPERIDMIHWGVQEPSQDDGSAPLVQGNYCSAVGSQARDYATLVEAMRRLPNIRLELVASPENLHGLSIPPNVSVRTNIPLRDVYNIIRHSRFLVLPLLHSDVPCGHVTIVTAMYLGKAVLATESAGITDYIQPDQTGLFAPPAAPEVLADRISTLWEDSQLTTKLGEAGQQFARALCTEQTTVNYVRQLLDRLENTGSL